MIKQTNFSLKIIFCIISNLDLEQHCVKSVHIRSCSGPYFPAFGLKTDQNNSEYGHFLRSADCSTNLCLVHLTDKILKGFDGGLLTGMILVDLQK